MAGFGFLFRSVTKIFRVLTTTRVDHEEDVPPRRFKHPYQNQPAGLKSVVTFLPATATNKEATVEVEPEEVEAEMTPFECRLGSLVQQQDNDIAPSFKAINSLGIEVSHIASTATKFSNKCVSRLYKTPLESSLGSLIPQDNNFTRAASSFKAVTSLTEQALQEVDIHGWSEKNVIEVSTATKFPKKCVLVCIGGICERVAHIKTRAQGMRCLITFSEAMATCFIIERTSKIMIEHKNPMVLSEGLLWMVFAAAALRNGSVKLIGVLLKFVGLDIKAFLSDVMSALLSVVEAEYEKNPYGGAQKKTVKASDSVSSVFGGALDSLHREDNSGKIISELLESSDLEMRLEATVAVNKIVEEANNRIQPARTVELFGAFRARLYDSNQNLIMATLTYVSGLASSMGPAIEKSNKGIASDTVKCIGDNKKHMRECTWVASTDLDKRVQYLTPMTTDGNKSAFAAEPLPIENKEFVIVPGKHRRQHDNPQETIQALDIVLRKAASHERIIVGRSLFSTVFEMGPLGNGVDYYRGFYQSLRPMGMGLSSLNIDMSNEQQVEPIHMLSGSYDLLDLLKSFKIGRQKEIQSLLENRPVSNFAHLNGLPSFLQRGRFLWNQRFVQDKNSTSVVAASELGLSNQTRTVSDLRKGIWSRAEYLVDSDDSSNKLEVRELLSRRRVSNLLQSGFGLRLDQLLRSSLERRRQEQAVSQSDDEWMLEHENDDRRGFYQSLRPMGMGLSSLNIDMSNEQQVEPIRMLSGSYDLFDLLKSFKIGRQKEIQSLLENRPVSNFAHLNGLPSFLQRGRFLWNQRFVQDETSTSVIAASELGTHTVSDLRKGIWSRAEYLVDSDDDSSNKLEIGELSSRRRVSNLLQSGFGLRLDQLLRSSLERRRQEQAASQNLMMMMVSARLFQGAQSLPPAAIQQHSGTVSF